MLYNQIEHTHNVRKFLFLITMDVLYNLGMIFVRNFLKSKILKCF